MQSAMTRWVQERQARGEELFPPSQVPQSKGSKARGARPAKRMYDTTEGFIHLLMVAREGVLTRPRPSLQDIADLREVLR